MRENNTQIHVLLTATFPGKLGLADGRMNPGITGFYAKFSRVETLPEDSAQKHTGLHLFCINYDS